MPHARNPKPRGDGAHPNPKDKIRQSGGGRFAETAKERNARLRALRESHREVQ